MRILLVDDEHVALESERKMLLEEFPFAEVKTARDALDAIHKASKTAFQIVLMDVCMPGMDGLGAIREIKKKLPDARMVVVSAFDRFEFAQTAVSLGVSEYLLKPVPQNQLLEVVRRLIDEIQVSERESSDRLKGHEKMDQLMMLAQQEVFERILSNAGFKDSGTDCLKLLGLNLAGRCVMMARFAPAAGSPLRRDNAAELIRENFERLLDCPARMVMPDRVMALVEIQPPGDEAQRILEKRCQYLIETSRTMLGIELTIGVGRPYPDEGGASVSCREAERALSEGRPGQVFFYTGTGSHSSFVRLPSAKELAAFVINRDFQKLRGAMQTLMDDWFEDALRSGSIAKLCALETLFEVNRRVLEGDGGFYMGKLEEQQRLMQQLSQADSEGRVRAGVEAYLRLMEACAEVRPEVMHTLVGRAAHYIEQHFQEDLALDQVAEYAGVSPFYLSRMFKQETGQGFLEYLTNLRIEKAKTLLMDERLSVRDVASLVGYPNQAYFGKIFRDKIGETPGEYRSRRGR
jgi:two-component system response regulator YesN